MLALCRAILAAATTLWVTVHTAIGAWSRPEQERLAYRVHRQMTGCRAVCRAVNMHVEYTDQAASLPSGTLVVSNHFSAMDPIILGSRLPVCFVGKVAIDRWPFFGWVCRTHGMLLANSRRRLGIRQLNEQIQSRLRSGVSVLVFSEGTTSDGDVLLPFKSGAFEGVAGWDGGFVQPVFLNVTAINWRPSGGSDGREALTHNRHPGFVRHLFHLYGHRRIDFSIKMGAPLAAGDHDRKSLARAAHEQVERLAINTDTTA